MKFNLSAGILLFLVTIFPTSLKSQTIPPPFINYQAVLYDVNNPIPNSVFANQSFQTFVNINDELGNLLYREEHFASTDGNGLITVKMGDGLYVAGPITNFNQIDWGTGKYYLVVDFNINGTISSTASEQLVTVPYSFYSGKAGNGVDHVSVTGDSLYLSDGQVFEVGGNSSGTGGFTHYLGETFNGGIIFYIFKGSDGLEHGLVVALTESTAQWQTSATLVNANRTWDGAYNTTLMAGSPAATYISSLGAGWYLPSIDELSKLYFNRFETNKALFTGGHTLLLSNLAYYLSSTECDALRAYSFDINLGNAHNMDKTEIGLIVRGVRAF
jgi:hypothetical protein